MTVQLKALCGAAVLCLAFLTGTATAADWNNGSGSYQGLKGSHAVPVPAPMPVPTMTAQWYFRVDGGVDAGNGSIDASESGLLFGLLDTPGDLGPTPFGARSSWLNSDYDTFATVGVGVGYHWSDRFRTDITFEYRTGGEVIIDGAERYVQHGSNVFYADGYGPNPHDGAGVGTRQVTVATRDITKHTAVFSLINGYYDIAKLHGFTPYIGGGVGLAWHQLNRSHSTSESTCDLSTTPACQTQAARGTYTRSEKSHSYALAAAAMAGVSYAFSDSTVLDLNYRYLHIGGTSATTSITDLNGNVSNSRVTIGDAADHQLRAGLRFNIN